MLAKKKRFRIGELAAEIGLTPQAIRFYETRGLLGPSERAGKATATTAKKSSRV